MKTKMDYEDIRKSPFITWLAEVYKRSERKEKVIGIELGVFKAAHAEYIMESIDIEKLYLIDPYEAGYEGEIADDIPEARDFAAKRMSKYGERIQWMYNDGNEALKKLAVKGVKADFIYIDGKHDYTSSLSNINHAVALVKDKGFVAGHDYLIRSNPPIEVKKAVDDFLKDKPYKFFTAGSPIPDWWFRISRNLWMREKTRIMLGILAEKDMSYLLQRAMINNGNDGQGVMLDLMFYLDNWFNHDNEEKTIEGKC
ncbi:hypothetical protein GF312_21725 [Candidatus Poribacteria bacterium]|nr:hypothetical protein [Candidatus Poribacteria bacterium]